MQASNKAMEGGKHGSQVEYEMIFTTVMFKAVPPDHICCALVADPYVVLAKRAIPQGKQPSDLLGMTLREWEQSV